MYEFLIKNIFIVLILIITIVLLIIFELKEYIYTKKSINTTKAISFINNKNAIILDFRKKENYDKKHIIKSINLKIEELKLKEKLIKKYKKNYIIIIADTNYKSYKILGKLKKLGITNVFYIYGGINLWIKENLPIKKTKI